MKEMHEETKTVFVKLQKKIKKYMDRNKKEAIKYKIGDKMFYIRKCGRVGVTSVDESSPSNKCE